MVSPEAEQSIKDEAHLTLLAIFHFVLAGFSTLGLIFIGGHYLVMSTVFNNPHFWDQIRAQQAQMHQPVTPFDPQMFFHAVVWFYIFLGGWSAVSMAANLAAGLCLVGRRARGFCIGVSAFNCISIPLGTLLGVFTIIVLMRPSVRFRYEQPSAVTTA